MSMFDDLKISKNIKKAEIFITYDDHKRPILYVGNGKKSVFIKRFFSDFQYKKFMIEAVMCHLYADKKYLKKVKSAYNNIVKVIETEVDNEII